MQTTVMCKNASQYCTACLSIILHDSKPNQLIRFNTCTLRIPLTFKHVQNNDNHMQIWLILMYSPYEFDIKIKLYIQYRICSS